MGLAYQNDGVQYQGMQADKPWEIYTLIDPRTDEVRYVGMTTRGSGRRYKQHVSQAKTGDMRGPHKARWVKSLAAKGLVPVLSVVETGLGVGWVEAERKWISFYKMRGCRLTNLTDGGEGCFGFKQSAASIEKMKESKKRLPKKPLSEAQRIHLQELHKRQQGRKFTEARKQQLRDAAKGREIPQYVRDALVEKRKGVSLSTEHKMAVSRGHRARRPKHVQDSEMLRDLYEIRLLSPRKIAKLWGVSECLVSTRLKEEGICTRSAEEAASIRYVKRNSIH